MRMIHKRQLAVALGVCVAASGAAIAEKAPQDGVAMLMMVGARTPAQGYLGVDIRDVGEEQVSALHLKDTRGAEIVQVDHDGPAGKAGLRERDVILQMNGQPVEGAEPLRQMLRATTPGRVVSFVICRDGQQQTLTAKLADRAVVERQAWEQHTTVPEPPQESDFAGFASGFFSAAQAQALAGGGRGQNNLIATTILSPSYTGAILETMGPQLAEYFGATGGAGLLVRSVDVNSPAAAAGMRAGDVVVRVNSTPIANGNDWSRTMHDSLGKTVNVVVLREKREQTLTLVPDGKKRSAMEWERSLPRDDGALALSALLPLLQVDLWFNQ